MQFRSAFENLNSRLDLSKNPFKNSSNFHSKHTFFHPKMLQIHFSLCIKSRKMKPGLGTTKRIARDERWRQMKKMEKAPETITTSTVRLTLSLRHITGIISIVFLLSSLQKSPTRQIFRHWLTDFSLLFFFLFLSQVKQYSLNEKLFFPRGYDEVKKVTHT